MKLKATKCPLKWKQLKAHEFAEFSEVGIGVEMDVMTEDMRQNGYAKHEEIILYEGQILDGRVRHACAAKADVPPSFMVFEGTEEEALDYVWRKRLGRQNLNPSQRSAYLEKYKARRAKITEKNGKPSNGVPLVDQRAAMAGVSPRTQDYAAEVYEKGTSAVQQAVESGDLTVSDAAKIVDEPAAVQDQAVKDVQAGVARTAAGALELLCSRCRRVGRRKDGKECKECKRVQEKARKKELKKKAKAKSSGFKDDAGAEIPSGLRDAFKDPLFQDTINFLEKVSEQVRGKRLGNSWDKKGKHFPFTNSKDIVDGYGTIIDNIDKIIRHAKETRPTHVCPACQGEKCVKCKRSGLLPAGVYREVKKALKGEK